jgi:endonuclease YncB( thermonuclease family)
MTTKIRAFVSAALAAMLLAPAGAYAAAAESTITGPASALGPDSIKVNDQRVILLGIDAPEANQDCYDAGNKIWHCADSAFAVLDQIVKAGPVTCALKGPRDPFGRRAGVCTVDGKDVAREMVEQGMAEIYPHDPESKDYAADQKAAKAAKEGLWADGVSFENPWEYRIKHNHSPFK